MVLFGNFGDPLFAEQAWKRRRKRTSASRDGAPSGFFPVVNQHARREQHQQRASYQYTSKTMNQAARLHVARGEHVGAHARERGAGREQHRDTCAAAQTFTRAAQCDYDATHWAGVKTESNEKNERASREREQENKTREVKKQTRRACRTRHRRHAAARRRGRRGSRRTRRRASRRRPRPRPHHPPRCRARRRRAGCRRARIAHARGRGGGGAGRSGMAVVTSTCEFEFLRSDGDTVSVSRYTASRVDSERPLISFDK